MRAFRGTVLAAVLLVAGAAQTIKREGLPKRCFDDVEPVASDRTIKFWQNDWGGHILFTNIAAILVKEKLGFPVEILTGRELKSTGELGWQMLRDGTVDINMEVWKGGALFIDDYVDVQRNVGNGGASGGVGTEGLFAPSYMVNTSETLACPVGVASGGVGRPAVAECQPDSFYVWWQTFQSEAKAVAFRVKDADPASRGCMYGVSSGWYPAGILQKYISALDLKLHYHHFENDDTWTTTHQVFLSEAMARKEPLLFYHFKPEAFHHRHDLVRIRFPSYTTKEDYSAGRTEFAESILTKVYNLRLDEEAPDVAHYVHQATLNNNQQQALLDQIAGGASVFDVACKFLKENEGWKKAVKSLPKDGCPEGTFVSGRSCLSCASNSYQQSSSHVRKTCDQCPVQTEYAGTGAVSSEKCLCIPGSYHSNGSSFTGGERCHVCETGSVCSGGASNPYCAPGYMIDFSPGNKMKVFKCNPPEACVGAMGNESCACGNRTTGPFCEQCLVGHFHASSGACEICPPGSSILANVGLTFTPLLMYMTAMLLTARRKKAFRVGMLIKYFHLASVIIHLPFSRPPVVLRRIGTWVLALTTADVGSLIPMQCVFPAGIQLWASILLQLFRPIVYLVTIGLFALLFDFKAITGRSICGAKLSEEEEGAPACRRSTSDLALVVQDTTQEDLHRAHEEYNRSTNWLMTFPHHVAACIGLMKLIYLQTAIEFIGFFNCRKVLNTGHLHMVNDRKIACDSDEYIAATPLAIIGIVIYVLGTPLLFVTSAIISSRSGFSRSFQQSSLSEQLQVCISSIVGQTGESRVEVLERLFIFVDSDQSGTLDRQEFVEKLLEKSMHMQTSFYQQEKLFLALDPNHSGVIEQSYFVNVVVQNTKWFNKAFAGIWSRFTEQCCWWEGVLLLQPVILMSINVLVDESLISIVPLLCLLCVLLFCLTQWFVSPLDGPHANQAQSGCLIANFFLLFCLICLDLTTEKDYLTARLLLTMAISAGLCGVVGVVWMQVRQARSDYIEHCVNVLENVLSKCPLFTDCQHVMIFRVCQKLQIQSFRAGDCIISFKDPAKLIFLIEGMVDVTQKGVEEVHGCLHNPPVFGLDGVMADAPKNHSLSHAAARQRTSKLGDEEEHAERTVPTSCVSATATTDGFALVISREDLESCFIFHPLDSWRMKDAYNRLCKTKLQRQTTTAAFEADVNVAYKKRVAKAKKQLGEAKKKLLLKSRKISKRRCVNWLETQAREHHADLSSAEAVEECLTAIRSADAYVCQSLFYIAVIVIGTAAILAMIMTDGSGHQPGAT